MKSFFQTSSVILILILSGFSVPQAQSTPVTVSQKPASKRPAKSIRFVPPTPPDPGEPGGRGQGGGSRGECRPYESLTAFVPKSGWGLTTSERPTIWFNVPQGLAEGVAIAWVLRDDAGKTIAKVSFKAPKTPPGVISLPVQTIDGLKVNQTYRWTFSIYCDPQEPDQPVTIRGRITRSALSAKLQAQIAAATPLEKATLYAENGIWYDSLTILGLQSQKDPAIAAAWTDLLQQEKLVPSGPIVPCCLSDLSERQKNHENSSQILSQ
ncbi:DUF928 domain-containing protein [Phormidesmis priestleyi]